MKTFATYLRVSTQKQGRSGLGLDAQRKMCNDFILASGGHRTQEFVDVESGTNRDRKGLQQAIVYCKQNDCSLVIAKLDRLARDVEFCFKVVNTGIDIHFTDMPTINTLLLGVFASVAQYERELTSDRTKKALAVKKAQGAKLGAQSEKYIQNYNKKEQSIKDMEAKKRGQTKRARFLASRDVTAFVKVLGRVFPQACTGNIEDNIDWKQINTQYDNRMKMLTMMRDFKEMDAEGTLFAKWDLSGDLEDVSLQHKLANLISAIKKSLATE